VVQFTGGHLACKVRRPEDRLGCGPLGSYELNSHPFFRNVDWTELLQV
jgi:hypothetical protein